jgi:long-chain acyl-CoA synthetase
MTFQSDIIPLEIARHIPGLFAERVRRSPNAIACRQFNQISQQWYQLTWQEMDDAVERWRAAFVEEKLNPGDRVAIMLRNCMEWVFFDLAALSLGLVTVPLYPNDRADSAAYILKNSNAKLLLIDNFSEHQDLAEHEILTSLDRVITLLETGTPISLDNYLPVDKWLNNGQPSNSPLADIDPNELATIVYTSGTTGHPKGVMLSHHNILWNAWSGLQSIPIYPEDNFLSFLPLSHTLERSIGYYLPIMAGASITYARSIPQLAEDLLEQKPTVLISVPRIYERIYNRVQDQLKVKPPFARKLFQHAIDIGWKNFEYQQNRLNWQPSLLLHPILNHLIGKKIQDRVGGKLRVAICGGAPLAEHIAKTFIALGLPILQGYGLTETSPVIGVNKIEKNLPRSIGLPLQDVTIKFSNNGELLTKSPGVMLGYWDNPEATADTIDTEGWLHTGDLGMQDEAGFIHITGRLKDIIVLANGEKIPPADMEMAITGDPLIEHALVIGEGRPFLSALVVLTDDAWLELAGDAELASTDREQLKSHSSIQQLLLERIQQQLHGFPSYAEVIRIIISLQPWTVKNGLSTPTLKAKRQQILSKYTHQINTLYEGH